MKSQLEIKKTDALQPFNEKGDSGSAVFAVNEDKSLECIGMAIGCMSNRNAVVTPIKDILTTLGPGVELKKIDIKNCS